MTGLIIFLAIFLLGESIGVILLAHTASKYKKQVKKLEGLREADALREETSKRTVDSVIRNYTQNIEEQKKALEEMQAALLLTQSANEEFKKKEEEDAKREEENVKAFEEVQKLLEEAEATNEVLLKCISGELTHKEALEQIVALQQNSIVKEEQDKTGETLTPVAEE